MKLAIIGPSQSGKTTVFNALTGAEKAIGTFGRIEANIAMVKVPDSRIDWLSGLYGPKKTTHADIEFIDVPGSIDDSSDPKIVAAARETDALVWVIRSFRNEAIPHSAGTIDPLRDCDRVNTGLLLADMVIAEKRMERLKVSVLKPTDKQAEEKVELSALLKIMEKLENGSPASEADLTDIEKKAIRSFQFLTLKPHLALLNVSEDALHSNDTAALTAKMPNSMAICASVEMEIRRLDENDRAAFLEDIGIKELSLNTFIRKAYDTLGLISFFTVGKDEVRAWTIKKDTPAIAAAGKIHSDLERGFIRAEVFAFDDLRSLGTERDVRNAGKFRTEGKDYVVTDGDIMNIKFSV